MLAFDARDESEWNAPIEPALALLTKMPGRPTLGNPTLSLMPTASHPRPPSVVPPTNPHEGSRIWSKFVLYSAPAISLHTRTGH